LVNKGPSYCLDPVVNEERRNFICSKVLLRGINLNVIPTWSDSKQTEITVVHEYA